MTCTRSPHAVSPWHGHLARESQGRPGPGAAGHTERHRTRGRGTSAATRLRLALPALAIVVALSATGCGPTAWKRADGSIVTGKIDYQKEPETGRTYHLYVPTSYDPRREYPLVITAHGTFPFDHAQMQRDRWVDVAERYGLIVCAPDFDSANGLLAIPVDHPAPELLRDEKATLKIIEEVKRRYHIMPHATMITGWSGGGYPAHFIGLRHPDLFRCIVSRTANFSPLLVSEETAARARHVHVYIFCGTFDLPGFKTIARDAYDWYSARGFENVTLREIPGGHDPHQQEAARYFADIVMHYPVVTIRATYADSRRPHAVRFQAVINDPDAAPGESRSVAWDFGDHHTAEGAVTTHDYLFGGTYNVLVSVTDATGRRECAGVTARVR